MDKPFFSQKRTDNGILSKRDNFKALSWQGIAVKESVYMD